MEDTDFLEQISDFQRNLLPTCVEFERGKATNVLCHALSQQQDCLVRRHLTLNMLCLSDSFFDIFRLLTDCEIQDARVFSRIAEKQFILSVNTGENLILTSHQDMRVETLAELREKLTQLTLEEDESITSIHLHGVENILPVEFFFIDKSGVARLDLLATNFPLCNSRCLMVCGNRHHVLAVDERSALVQMMAHSHFLWPLLMPGGKPDPSGRLVWNQEQLPQIKHSLPFIPFEHFFSAASPLVKADGPIRHAIIVDQAFGKTQRIAELIQSEMKQQINSTECQLDTGNLTISLIEKDSGATRKITGNRRQLDYFKEETGETLKHLQRCSKEALTGQNEFFKLVEKQLDLLDTDSIVKQKKHKVHQLELKKESLETLKLNIWQYVLERHEKEQLIFVSDVKKIMKNLARDSHLEGVSLPMPEGIVATEFEIEKMSDYLDFKPRYKGEIKQRGFGKRLGESRRAVFMLLMSLSLFGSMIGFNFRKSKVFSVIFFLIFVGSFIYTFISWKKDDAFTMGKEIDKLQDQLRSEIMRAINDIERERMRLFQEHVAQLTKNIEKSMAQSYENITEQQKNKVSETREMVKTKGENVKFALKTQQKMAQTLRESLQEFMGLQQEFNQQVGK